MSRSRRLWRYEVTEVDGFPDGAPVEVGTVLIDRWKADRCWSVYNLAARPVAYVGSWSAKLLGEYDGPLDTTERDSNPTVAGDHNARSEG